MPPRNSVNYKSVKIPLDPISVNQLGGQTRSLYSQFSDQMTLLKHQRKLLAAQRKLQVGNVRDDFRQQIGSIQGAANERGTLGGSQQFLDERQAADNRDSQIAAARNAFQEGLFGNTAQAMQARRDYESGLFNVQAQRAALKNQGANDAFLQGFLGQLAKGSGGGKGGGGGPNNKRLKRGIRNDRVEIKGLLDQLRATGAPSDNIEGKAVNSLRSQLQDLWRSRNRKRKRLGKDPIRRKKLNDLIASILNSGGGGTGSQV